MPYIGYSDEVAEALSLFKKFNYERIYLHERLVNEQEKIRSMFADLFDHHLHDAERDGPRSLIYQDFLNAPWVSPTYRDNVSPAMAVRDYIAGMTDRYFNAAVDATKGVSRHRPNVAI
jgi:dGTPase